MIQHIMKSEVFNLDCMVGMKQYPDKYFDLAMVDPPYGIGDFNQRAGRKIHKKIEWNNDIPDSKYFTELERVSKHRIIWGSEYYAKYINDRGRIVHDKTGGGKRNQLKELSDVDIASHSFGVNMKIFHYLWQGNVSETGVDWDNTSVNYRNHPCQKPIALYEWCYKNYLPKGGKVLDTHLGSGSNRIAADKMGNIEFTGYEVDHDYFNSQEKRWKNYKAQLKLFI